MYYFTKFELNNVKFNMIENNFANKINQIFKLKKSDILFKKRGNNKEHQKNLYIIKYKNKSSYLLVYKSTYNLSPIVLRREPIPRNPKSMNFYLVFLSQILKVFPHSTTMDA